MLALAGWLSGARLLAGELANYVPMAPSTALLFLLISGALFCYARWPGLRLSRLFTLITVVIAFLTGLLVLGEFITGVDLGVEQVLSRTNEFMGAVPLGRMSPLTAVAFLLESTVFLLLIAEGWRNALPVAAVLAGAATALNAVVLLGYAYGAPLLYGGMIIPVALPTAIAFVLVGVGQFYLVAPGIRALRDWSSTSMRGMLLRAFLPFMLFFVLLDGWVGVKFHSIQALNPAVWHSVESLVAGILIVIITGWIARRSGSELERAQQTLVESEEKFRSVFEYSPLGKSLTGIDGSLKVNQAFCDILGYTEEELLAKHWKEFTYPDDVQKGLDASQELLDGRISRAHFEKRYFHKNGNIVWTEITIALLKDKTGESVHFITTINDITERRQAQDELRRAKDTLETMNLELRHSLAREEVLARTDGLTGLCNRSYFGELATREFHTAVRYQRTFYDHDARLRQFQRDQRCRWTPGWRQGLGAACTNLDRRQPRLRCRGVLRRR